MFNLTLFEAVGFSILFYLVLFIFFYRKLSRKKQIILLAFHIFFASLICVTLLPLYYDSALIADKRVNEVQGLGINFIPIKEMIRLYHADKQVFLLNIGGNFILLMPIVIIALFKNQDMKFYKIFLLLFFTSITIESLQLLKNYLYQFRTHVVDIDDLILNVLGGLIIYVIYKLFFYKKKR